MTDDYTPTTDYVEEAWCPRYDGEHAWFKGDDRRGYEAEFDRWLKQVKAEAWDEGKRASDTAWEHAYFGHPVPEGEFCPECCTGNPYRQGTQA